MPEQDTPTPDAAEDSVESVPSEEVSDGAIRRRRRLIKWGVVGLVVALVVLLVLPVFSTLQPNYYRRYPAMAKRIDNWSSSTHSRMSCVQCHVEPGPGGFLSFAAASIPAFYSQLLQGPKTTNLLKAPSRKACQKCHTSYRTVSPAGDLRIPHRAHVEVLKLECVVCHKDLVHSVNRAGFNRPEMQGCLQCHNGDKASNKCVDCHTRKQTPPTHKQKDWLKVHGQGADLKECSCHSWTPSYCVSCHEQRPSSHVDNWKKGHGPEAKKRGPGCLVCHGGEKFCKKCH